MIKKISPFRLCGMQNFPYIEQDFDALTDYGLMCKITEKMNEIISFMNTELTQRLKEYIEKEFNNIMLDTMYEEETETLIMYLRRNEG